MYKVTGAVLAVLAASTAAAADFGTMDFASRGWSPFIAEFLRSLDISCFICLIAIVIVAGLGIDAFYLIRFGRLIPENLLSSVQEEMANGEYEKALDVSLKSDCLAGQIFASALSKTDHSFERMEGAMRCEVEILSLVWRQWVSQFKLLALIGLSVGVLGALVSALRLVAELPGRPNIGLAFASSFEMRSLLYCSLGSLFFGLLAAALAVVLYLICSAKLERIIIEATRLGEELLDPFRPLPQMYDDEEN